MSFGSDSPGGAAEGIGGNESGIGDSGGMGGGEGGFGGLGIGNPGSYGGQRSVGAPGFGGGGMSGMGGGIGMDNDAIEAQNMAMAMAQSDIQAMQNNMEMGLASNPSLGLNEVGQMMDAYTGMSQMEQERGYGAQADRDLSRSLASRSLAEQLSAYNTAKKVGADTTPNKNAAIGSLASGIIDFAAGKIGPVNSIAKALSGGRTVGEIGRDIGYADLSRRDFGMDTLGYYGERSSGRPSASEGLYEPNYSNFFTGVERPSDITRS